MVWPRLKVIWCSKDNPTGHSKKKAKRSKGRVKKDFASLIRAAEDKTRGKGIVIKLSVCPNGLARLWDRLD